MTVDAGDGLLAQYDGEMATKTAELRGYEEAHLGRRVADGKSRFYTMPPNIFFGIKRGLGGPLSPILQPQMSQKG